MISDLILNIVEKNNSKWPINLALLSVLVLCLLSFLNF